MVLPRTCTSASDEAGVRVQKMLRFYTIPKRDWECTGGVFAAAKLDTDLCAWVTRLLRQRGTATFHARRPCPAV